MKKHRLKRLFQRKNSLHWLAIAMLFSFTLLTASAQNYGTPTRYEAENGFNSSETTTSSANAGYSGSGYLTGFTATNAETRFYKGADTSFPLTKLEIRYANGTGTNVTNLALHIGSNHKVQDLVFPATASWSTWGTLTVFFSHDPSWGGDIRIVASSNVTTSVNIDYTDVSVSDGVMQAVATPVFSPAGGSYTATQSVSITSSTSGATIYYTTDGSSPTTASTVYTSSLNVASTQTIKAIAAKSGMSNSAVGSATYTITIPTAAAPTFNPTAGTYATTQSVTISTATSGATIYYTTDSSTPTTSSTVYSTAISVATSKTIKAIAVKTGLVNSSVSSAAYIISAGTVSTPTFSPAAGTFTTAQSVSLSTATSGATIYYTTDGTTPTQSSTVYSSAISVSATATIKALAVKSGMTNSTIASALYTINAPVAPGSFTQTSPASGSTSVSKTPAFTWASSSNATSYSLVVSTNSGYTSPVINVSGITSTSYTPSAPLANSTQYYWKVTATNSIGSTVATNSGISFTTSAAVTGGGAGFLKREYWAGISGTSVASLTGNSNYPNNPTSTTFISSFDSPTNVGLNYGQRVSGYVTAPTSGAYKFWIASDDDSELWLSTDGQPSNKVKIASVTGWTNPQEYSKYASQASASITLTAGTQYYIEALNKQQDGGDNLTVAWQTPGGSQVTIPGSALSTVLIVPPPVPGTFNQASPSSGTTNVATAPTFSWSTSSDAATYSLIVSTNSSFTNPLINVSGLTATSYVAGTSLSGNTTYYWKVTSANSSGTRVAANAGISFTTLVPPAPGSFAQTTPANSASGVSSYPAFNWGASSNAASYTLVVSTNSAYTNPVINLAGLSTTSYSAGTPLAVSTLYYWKVTAINGTGSTIATNAGISFTTASVSGTFYYVATTGVDAPGNGSSTSPWKTLAYAASQVTAGTGNKTISLAPGTYVETACTLLPLGVNVVGAGESSTIITTNGDLPSPGADKGSADYHLWADGSLIQLKSPIYSGVNPRYGDPSLMIAPQNGTQTLSGFKLDGHNKTVKAGIWVENRNNVTVHHVTFTNFQQSGAVFSRGDMWYYVPLPEGKWMTNTTGHDLTFINAGSTSGGEQVGNLCMGGLDGAEFYNININDPNGEGIKFEHVGHFRNTKIHDCSITVGETDPTWGEKISIELWNMSYNNEIYNITCNTWLSMVNHSQFDDYQPTVAHPSNLKIHHVTMIDGDNVSGGIEAVESALSGVEIYDSYFQDKGFGIAIWGGSGWGGDVANHNIYIHNNIFARVNIPASFGFGNSAAVFVPDPANNIKIYNNVFDNLGNSLQLTAATTVDIKNNIFQNSQGDDIQGGSGLTIKNNLRYNTDPQRQSWVISGTLGTGNIQGNPGLLKTGSRASSYYQPSSASSLVVDKGIDVGIPYNSTLPDIGRWEFGGGGGRVSTPAVAEKLEEVSLNELYVSPNPTKGVIKIITSNDIKIIQIGVMTIQGKVLIQKTPSQFNYDEVDISQLPDDFYLIQVRHEKGIITKKIILIK